MPLFLLNLPYSLLALDTILRTRPSVREEIPILSIFSPGLSPKIQAVARNPLPNDFDFKNADEQPITLKYHLLYAIGARNALKPCTCDVGAESYHPKFPWYHSRGNDHLTFFNPLHMPLYIRLAFHGSRFAIYADLLFIQTQPLGAFLHNSLIKYL